MWKILRKERPSELFLTWEKSKKKEFKSWSCTNETDQKRPTEKRTNYHKHFEQTLFAQKKTGNNPSNFAPLWRRRWLEKEHKQMCHPSTFSTQPGRVWAKMCKSLTNEQESFAELRTLTFREYISLECLGLLERVYAGLKLFRVKLRLTCLVCIFSYWIFIGKSCAIILDEELHLWAFYGVVIQNIAKQMKRLKLKYPPRDVQFKFLKFWNIFVELTLHLF